MSPAQIVQDNHLITGTQQTLDHMRTDIAGASHDKDGVPT